MKRLTVGLSLLLFLGGAGGLYLVQALHPGENAQDASSSPSTPFGWPAKTVAWAGDGTSGLAEGSAGLARFADPFGLSIDREGNLYSADAGDNNRIRKITPAGMVTTFAGAEEGFADGTDRAAFNTPSGLAIDDAGNLFVADTGNNAIRKITPQGVVTTLAGDGVAGYRDGSAGQARFNGPIGVAVDKAGTVFVADTYNDRIRAISSAGQVTTLAGGGGPGFRDGQAGEARFDTPCAVLVDGKGDLIVADTRNDAIRTISAGGRVGTLIPPPTQDASVPFRRPVSLAMTPDGFLYVGTMAHGRIFQISPGGEMRGLTGLDIDIPRGDDTALRLVEPNGLAVGPDGALFATDSPTHTVRKIVRRSDVEAPVVAPDLPSAPSVSLAKTSVPWPVNPNLGFHEIVGTMGEVRGNDQGDSRDHFHGGLDVQANIGTPVLAVTEGKVSEPLTTWGYDTLGEGLSIGPMSYIHVKVGRMADNALIDPARFLAIKDDSGQQRIRVRRGTRFGVGDTLGTVNRMYHVHLEFSPDGALRNPLELPFPGVKDRIPPRIEAIQLFDHDGKSLTAKRGDRVLVPAGAGDVSIVVSAFDQFDGNSARRRIGLYKVGYQILSASGDPLAGFERPLVTLQFDQLPPDREAVKIAYADGSGETVHGSAATRFLYVVTNVVQDGHARTGSWPAAALPRGDYVLRIFASDYAGNVTTVGRDLPLTLN